MVKQFNLTSRTLEDNVVLDGINALNALKEEQNLAGAVAGGMATQSYVPSQFHRETIDIDFTSLWNGSFSEFKKLCTPLASSLNSLGYEGRFRKTGLVYEIVYENPDTQESFMIQHPHRSKNNFEKIRKYLERNVANRRDVNAREVSFQSISPEDVIVSKANRISLYSDIYSLRIPRPRKYDLRRKSDELKKDIMVHAPDIDPRDVAKLRLINDCYDIVCLSESVDLDKSYFNEIMRDWEQCKGNGDQIYSALDKLGVEFL